MTLILTGAAAVCGLMFLLWLAHFPMRNASIVDPGWAAGLAILGLIYGSLGDGYWPRSLLMMAMASIWGFRLSGYLLIRVLGHPEEGRYVASWIPRARYVEFPGHDHLPFVGAQDEFLTEIEEFLGFPKKDRTRALSKRKSVTNSAAQALGISAAASAQRLTREERTSRDYLAQIAMFRSHDEEEDMLRDLRVVEATFAKWNISLLVDVEALGMASLWGRKRP